MAAEDVPLLQYRKPYFFDESCPGCLVDRRKATSKGAPKKELALIAYMVLCNALPISSIFPFIYFMVRDFGIAKSATRIGTYAGYIGKCVIVWSIQNNPKKQKAYKLSMSGGGKEVGIS